MAMNLSGAASAAKLIYIEDFGPFMKTINQKEKRMWKNQVLGAYDLLFPHIHNWFPNRTETTQQIHDTMRMHYDTTNHLEKSGEIIREAVCIGVAGHAAVMDSNGVVKNHIYTSIQTPAQPTVAYVEEMVNFTAEMQKVRIVDDNINRIGYGAAPLGLDALL